MKKIFLFLVLFSLFISLVSAIDVEITPNVKLGENVLMKVSGNFLENITKEDVSFYRRHMKTQFSQFDVVKIQDDFYIYALVGLTKTPDNYSIKISGVSYMKGAVISEEAFFGNFSIVNEIADFSLKPGAANVENNISVEVQNLKESKININAANEEYSLKSGEIKEFKFKIENESQFMNLEFSSENQTYILPVYFNYVDLNDSVKTNDSLDNYTVIEEDINENEEDNPIVIIDENKTEEKESFFDKLFGITKNKTNETIPEESVNIQNCNEMDGQICESGFKCENDTIRAFDGSCCLTECIEKKTDVNKKTIGWILIIVVVLFLAWFFGRKYRGTRNTRGLLGRRY